MNQSLSVIQDRDETKCQLEAEREKKATRVKTIRWRKILARATFPETLADKQTLISGKFTQRD